ncbi:MAG: hypothetical protein L0287_20080 [Anaerolineae bacterium]|nr:hypothetical protein [Anaerolineae bacterium]
MPRSISTTPYPRPFGRWKPLPQGDMPIGFAYPLLTLNNLSILSKSFLPVFLFLQASLLFACNSAWQAQPQPNFGFVLEFGSCSIDTLDTFKGEFTQDRVIEPSITIPIQLSDEQMRIIYEKMIEINITGYPEVFEVHKPLIGEVVMLSSPYNYDLMIQNGESKTSIRWTDNIAQPTTAKADRLRELFRLIIQMVHEHPGYQGLPDVKFGCI